MISGEGTSPWTVRAAALLSLAPLPFGVVVTALNISVTGEAEQVVREALAGRPDLIRLGLQHVDSVARARTAEIAALFVLFALVMGWLAWIAWRGSSSRSGLVPSLAVVVSLSYGFWLFQAYLSHPVTDDFWYPLWDSWYETRPGRSGLEPFTGHTTVPPEYESALATTLVAASGVQLVVLILLMLPASRSRLKRTTVHPRAGILLALVGPASAVAYAVVNFLGISRAAGLMEEQGFHGPVHMAASAREMTWQMALVLFVLAAIFCTVLLPGRRWLAPYVALTAFYVLVLLLALAGNLSEMSSETSGFTDFRPWWRTPAVVHIAVVAAVAQVVSLVHAFEARSRPPVTTP
ncbi:hypothetical protein ACIBKY_37835 [Nonomuraea sp. NPDC050394]|uniref:hypothetical protein n=1 Tax=Nonomuraea sp. NPDC050394 TaxID=3364363 RepID=UPI0037A81629